jgi:hypothetical protein
MDLEAENKELRERLQLAIQTLKELRWGLFKDIKIVEKLIDGTLEKVEGEQKIQSYFDYEN